MQRATKAGCPISFIEQDGQSYSPGAGAVCFQTSSFDTANWCNTPSELAGHCLTLDFPMPTLGTSGIYNDVITHGSGFTSVFDRYPRVLRDGIHSRYTLGPQWLS